MVRKGHYFILALLMVLFLSCAEEPSEEKPEVAVEEPAWNMKTEMVVVDNCPAACPCLFGQEPHHGYCRFVGAVHIVEGNYKGTPLDGVNWAFFSEFTGKSTEPQFRYSAYYIDSTASEAQQSALREILSEAPFSTMGEQLGIKVTSVMIEKPTTEKNEYTLTLGDLGEFSVVLVYGNDPETPQKVLNPVYPFPAKEIIIGLTNGKFSDHGRDLNLENSGAEISEFTLSGS
ncbi:MAG: DUF1326 domain-containing protein [bacterium]